MDERARHFRKRFPIGSSVRIKTKDELYLGTITDISDYFIDLKTRASNIVLLNIAEVISCELKKEGTEKAAPTKSKQEPPPKTTSKTPPKYFALALQATSDEDAIKNLYLSIENHEAKAPSAVKDLANRLAAIGRGDEAIQVLHRYRSIVRDQQSIDNLLTNIFFKLKRYQEALELLEKKIHETPSSKQNIQTLQRAVDCHIRLKNYTVAIPYLQEIIKLATDSKPSLKRLALCHIQEKHYHAAEQIIQELLTVTPNDERTLALKKALHEARETNQLDENLMDIIFQDTPPDVSEFAKFFLKRCEFRGISANRLQEKKFDPSDIDRTINLALGAFHAQNYSDSADYYLSAAAIIYQSREWGDTNSLNKYLYRSFLLHGDVSMNHKELDVAREWYCEALNSYDQLHRSNRDDKEAIVSIVKFLYLNVDGIPLPTPSTDITIERAIADIFRHRHKHTQFFDALVHLHLQSKRARQLVLPELFKHPEARVMAFQYASDLLQMPALKTHEYTEPRLIELWSLLDKQKRIDQSQLYTQIDQLADFEVKNLWLEKIEQNAHTLRSSIPLFFLQLDRQRLEQLSTIFGWLLQYFSEVAFEQREYFCKQIIELCLRMLNEIQKEPTKFSVEHLYTVIEHIQQHVADALQQIYANSAPQIKLHLVEPYHIPDTSQQLTIQITVNNGEYCSPAEAVEITIPSGPSHLFAVENTKIQLQQGSSLQGGHEDFFVVNLTLTDEAIKQEAFSLPVTMRYRTRTSNIVTLAESFSIQLHTESVEKIDPNPYQPHISGTPVHDPKMFFGRDELIDKMTHTIAHSESKGLVIYGQKRVGKSSILHHLKQKLESKTHLLIADLGSITTIEAPTDAQLQYQIYWQILDATKKAIERRRKATGHNIRISFPKSSAIFLAHPAPIAYFQETLDTFYQKARTTTGWEDVRIVLLIDEFQYIYQLIQQGKISTSFMKQWKALLEKNLFNAVLVGQNVMTKFMQDYPNEFATMQTEAVSYLEDKYAQQLIENPIWLNGEEGATRYRQGAIKRILDLTAGSPYYIQIFCYHLVEYMNREGIKLVTEVDVDKVKSSLLKGKNAYFKVVEDFDNLLTGGSLSYTENYLTEAVDVMACIARNSLGSPCARESIDCATTQIDTILDDYVSRGVIQREYGQYTLTVGLFKEWLNLHK